ncbi:hypothetical protein GCM10020221_17540 [Streptomyces thioluteus]|uniref:Uncharacterized protein n=1 Tax=Streptomyces thioluteus TaxID=66431 RepID=A0ABN3WP78_STRTU
MRTAFPYHPSQDSRGDRLTPPVLERNARRSRGVSGRITWAHALWIEPELERRYGGDRHDPGVNRERARRLCPPPPDAPAPRPLGPPVPAASALHSRAIDTVGADPDDEAFDLIRRTHSGYLCELAVGIVRSGAPHRTEQDADVRTPFTAFLPEDGAPVSRAAALLTSTARELLAQWYDAHHQAGESAQVYPLPPPAWACHVFSSSVRHEFCRRVREEPGHTPARRREAASLMDAAAGALPPPASLRAALPGGVQGSVVNELLALSYPLWDRVRFCLDSPFDGLGSL